MGVAGAKGSKVARGALAVVLIWLGLGGPARAELRAKAEAQHGAQIPLDEYTALMVPGGGLKLGILSIEYGLTDRVSVGIDPAPYLMRAFADFMVPNAHVKVALLRHELGTVSARLGGYYARLESDTGSDGRILLVPVSVFGSGLLVRRLWLHLEVNYNYARGLSSDVGGRAEVEGTVATTNWQGGAMLEYRLSSLIGLLLRGRAQTFTSPLIIRAEGMLDPFTSGELAAEYRPTHENPWVAVAAVAFTWKHVGLVAGGGYGQYFIPGGNLAVPYRGFTPEASLWVQF